MEFIKKNIKWIISVVALMIIVSGVSVYATSQYLASQITYTKNGETISVEDALNDLYLKANSGFTITDYTSGSVTKSGSVTDWYSENISIPSGVKDVIIYAHTMSDYGIPDINVSGNIISSNDKNKKYTFAAGGNYAASMYVFTIKTSGEEGILNVNSTIEARYPNNTFHHGATLIVAYK